MEEWDATFRKIEGDIPDNLYKTLCKNLPKYGIYLDNNFLAANTYGGYIMKYEEAKLHVTTINFKSIYYHSKFIISVNRNLKTTEKFHTICHELGHLFCCHQHYSPSKRRYLTKKEREFEAETVAWLVCKRLGIKNPSEEEEGFLNPTTLFDIHNQGFNQKIISTTDGVTYIELYPKIEMDFLKIGIWVNVANSTIQKVTSLGKDGNQITIAIKSIKSLNPVPEDAFFSFDKTKHPDVEVVDMR
jgi:hypothetical protein